MPKIHYQRQVNGHKKSTLTKQLKQDEIAVEEPLQISLSYYNLQKLHYQTKILTLTMRTPGEDKALIYGFLLCEGIIKKKNDISACEFKVISNTDTDNNAVCVILAQHVQPDWKTLDRQFTNHSSCGICGKTSLNALQLKSPTNTGENLATINSDIIFQLPDQLRTRQAIFSQTGGLHAAGLYSNNQIVHIAEDVGRHNAVDKVIGLRCLSNINHKMVVLVLSGRISFELVQKAIMANINIIVSVGAPSDLAVTAAKSFDLTLIGFTKADCFNVYNGDWRIK